LTVYIGISAGENSMVMANARQQAMVVYQKVTKPLIDQRVKHTRWMVTRYPTHAAAQEAKMSLEEYEDYLFSACCIDWNAESRKQEKLKRLMDRTGKVCITAPDTNISFSIKGLPGSSVMAALTCRMVRYSPRRFVIRYRGISPITAQYLPGQGVQQRTLRVQGRQDHQGLR